MISNTKVLTISLLIILTCLGSLTAQRGERGQRGERLEAQRIAFITSELDLTSTESERFWTIYNEYRNLEKEQRIDVDRKAMRGEVSDSEADELLKKMILKEETALANKKRLINDLQPVIGKGKIVKLFSAERRFKRKVLNEFSKRKGRDRSNQN